MDTPDNRPSVTDVIGVETCYFDDQSQCVSLDINAFPGVIANKLGFHAYLKDNLVVLSPPAVCYYRYNGYVIICNGEEVLPLDASPEEILGYWISHLSASKGT